MKKKFIFILLILLFLPFVLATNVFEYQIVGDKTIVEIEIQSKGELNFVLPYDFSNLEVNGEYDLKKISEGTELSVLEEGLIKIQFVTKTFIEKRGDEFLFMVKNKNHFNSTIIVKLQEGASLSQEYLPLPKNPLIETNGQSIFLIWEGGEQIFVPYKIPKKTNWFSYILSAILLFGVFIARSYFKKEKKKNISNNLFKEEKEIVKYLLSKKECWTKELSRDLKIPKVRLSRKLRTLEEKGLIERIPHGNENRIILIKK